MDFKSLNLEEKQDKINIINEYMDYRLKIVGKDTEVPRDAINIAKIMGLKAEIIEMAEKNIKGR